VVDGRARISAALKRVPRKVADLLRAGAFRQVSASWWPAGKAPGFPQVSDKPILRHLGLCGADPVRQPQLGTLDDVARLYAPSDPPPVPAAMAGGADEAAAATLDLPAELAASDEPTASADDTPPATLSEAVQKEAATSRLQPVFRAIQDRLWTIEDKEGRTEEEKADALRALGEEIAAFFAEYDAASPGETPAEEAAAATEAGAGDGTPAEQGGESRGSLVTADPVSGDSGAARGASDAIRDKPGAPNAAVAPASDAPKPPEMSAAVADAVSATIARLVGAGRLAPKHAPRLRAEAAACLAHGGEAAVYAYLDDEEARRSAQVVPLGETGQAAAAGPAAMAGGATPAEASAGDEYERLGLARSLGITKEAYVRARCAAPLRSPA